MKVAPLSNVIDIAASNDGTVWAVTGDHKVHDYQGGPEPFWADMPGQMAQVSMQRAPLGWALDPAGHLYNFQWFDNTWNHVSDGPFISLASNSENEVWVVDQHGKVATYGTEGDSQQVPGRLVSIAAGASTWGIDHQDDIYRLSDDRKTWTRVPGKLRQISVGDDGVVMGVTASGDLYYLDGNSWLRLGSGYRKISCGNDGNVWAINAAGNAWCIASESMEPPADTGDEQWLPAPGKRWDSKDKYDQNKSTHLWMVCRAAEVAKSVPLLGQRLYDLVKPGAQESESQFHDALCQGLWDADDIDPYRNSPLPGDTWYGRLLATYKSHFFDPSTGKNWRDESDPTALTEGTRYFGESADTFKDGNLYASGYFLGLALHYLTDMTQPMHSTNFTYLSSVPVGFHSAFETLAIDVMHSVQTTAPYRAPDSLDPGELIKATARKSASRASRITNVTMQEAWYNLMAYAVDNWSETATREIKGALADGVASTAQFLIAWMDAVKETVPNTDPRIFGEIHETSSRTWWALHKDGHMLLRDGYGAAFVMEHPGVDGPVTHLYVDGSDYIYAIAGKEVMMLAPGTQWRKVYPPIMPDDDSGMTDIVQLVVVAPARQWALDSNGRVFHGTGTLPSVAWEPTDSPPLTAISSSSVKPAGRFGGDDSCWAIDAASNAWQYTNQAWTKQGTAVAKAISVDSKGRPWGVSPAGRVVTFDQGQWFTPGEFDPDTPFDNSMPDLGSLEWISVQRSTLVIDSDGVPWGPAVLATNENTWMPLA